MVMRSEQVDQVSREGRRKVLITICYVRNEVDMLSQCLDGGGVGRAWIGDENGVCRLILIVLINEVLSV